MTSGRTNTVLAGIAWFTIYVLAGCASTPLYQYNHYMKVKNYEAAAQVMNEEINTNPHNPEFHLLLGEAYLKQREYEEAKISFQNSRYSSSVYVDRIQKLLEVHYQKELRRGIKAMRNERYELALTYFNKALEINANRHEPYPSMGYIYFKLQQYNKAYDSYLRATELNDSDAQSYHALSELTFREGDYTKAAKYARQATAIDNDLIPALEMLVYTGIKLEDLDMSEQAYLAIPEKKRTFNLSRNYSFELFNRGKYESALPHLETLKTQHPANSSVLRTLAETYYQLNNLARTAETYEVLWQQNPGNQDYLIKIISAYNQMGNHRQADKYKGYIQEMEGSS